MVDTEMKAFAFGISTLFHAICRNTGIKSGIVCVIIGKFLPYEQHNKEQIQHALVKTTQNSLDPLITVTVWSKD